MASLPDFPADDFEEALDPGVFVEPKDRDPASEDDRQAAFIATMRRTAHACRAVAIPNGTHIASMAGRAKARRLGLLAGEPDTKITWADALPARIEFKNGRNKPSPEQIHALNWYHLRGHPVAVCRTAKGAMRWLRSIGAPVPEVG